MAESKSRHPLFACLTLPVIVAALGYFVDIYDLILFSVVRVPSLTALGVSGDALMSEGVFILNAQMGGMLIGGILWGILGDKKGRLSVLLGSILLYSLANFLNAFVTNVEQYALLRFLAGIGLAGELGAGVTLVSEILPKESRGYGTMMIATIGVTGAIAANLVAEHFDWRVAYAVGGILGFALLLLRFGIFESKLFSQTKEKHIKRGDFLSLFTRKSLFLRYAKSIAIGVPLWFCVGILIVFSPEFAKALDVQGSVTAGKAIMFCYAGLAIGDFASGYISQQMQSRKKVLQGFLVLTAFLNLLYFSANGISNDSFYLICFSIGVACGYWALFITIAAEQFGTNIRATVATTVPNFVRGMVVPITSLFLYFKASMGAIGSGLVLAGISLSIAFLALFFLEETYHKDLDYIEV